MMWKRMLNPGTERSAARSLEGRSSRCKDKAGLRDVAGNSVTAFGGMRFSRIDGLLRSALR